MSFFRTAVTLQISGDKGKTWRTVPTIGDVRIEYGLPIRRKPGKRRKRAQQVRRSLR